ncbi:DUF3336 domain containing protein [Pyrenophora tritici-repentis]|nr:DUF3336 domain containing protein [Pyrenophora tritici-repentis]
MNGTLGVVSRALWSFLLCFFDVAFFWQRKLYAWWTQKSQRYLLLEAIGDARLFEEWEAAAYKLDEVLDYDMW